MRVNFKKCTDILRGTLIKGTPGKYFDEITKNIQCPALFSNPDIDMPSKFKVRFITIARLDLAHTEILAGRKG